MAIVGLNSGAQPIADADNDAAMSVNGEIYNHEELETELKKKNPNLFDAFTTDSDCEVLLHLYKTKVESIQNLNFRLYNFEQWSKVVLKLFFLLFCENYPETHRKLQCPFSLCNCFLVQ